MIFSKSFRSSWTRLLILKPTNLSRQLPIQMTLATEKRNSMLMTATTNAIFCEAKDRQQTRFLFLGSLVKKAFDHHRWIAEISATKTRTQSGWKILAAIFLHNRLWRSKIALRKIVYRVRNLTSQLAARLEIWQTVSLTSGMVSIKDCKY